MQKERKAIVERKREMQNKEKKRKQKGNIQKENLDAE